MHRLCSSAITSECAVISASLSRLQTMLLGQPDRYSALAESLETSLLGCALTISVLQEEIGGVADESRDGALEVEKFKYVLEQDHLKELLQQIRGQQISITLLLQTYQRYARVTARTNHTLLKPSSSVMETPAAQFSGLMQLTCLTHGFSESLNDVKPSMQDYNALPQQMANKGVSLWRGSHLFAQQRAPPVTIVGVGDADSGFELSSIITGTRFDFDDEVVDSEAYRRALSSLRRVQNLAEANLEGLPAVLRDRRLQVNGEETVFLGSGSEASVITARLEDQVQTMTNLRIADEDEQSFNKHGIDDEHAVGEEHAVNEERAVEGRQAVDDGNDSNGSQQVEYTTQPAEQAETSHDEETTTASVAGSDEPDCPCKGCGQILEEDKALELAGSRWHIDCFRCNTCGTLVDDGANLLLLADGSIICNDCTYSCSSCGIKIEDLAILSGDQAFCANCFKCRNCKRKIEGLTYARTSQGLFCMDCHEYWMARRRKKTANKAGELASTGQDKALPVEGGAPILPTISSIPSNAGASPTVVSSPSSAGRDDQMDNELPVFTSTTRANESVEPGAAPIMESRRSTSRAAEDASIQSIAENVTPEPSETHVIDATRTESLSPSIQKHPTRWSHLFSPSLLNLQPSPTTTMVQSGAEVKRKPLYHIGSRRKVDIESGTA